MRRLIIATSLGPIAIIIGGALLDYVTGRAFTIPIANFFPAVALAAVVMLVCWVAAIVTIVASACRGQRSFRQISYVAASVTLCVFVFVVCLRFRPYLVGLRHATFARCTPSELREAAAAINETLEVDAPALEVRSSLPGPGKWSIWNENRDRTRWNKVTARAPCIARLPSSVWIFRNNDYVSFVWGGALTGHAGFNIGPKAPGGDFETLRYSDDIVFWMGH